MTLTRRYTRHSRLSRVSNEMVDKGTSSLANKETRGSSLCSHRHHYGGSFGDFPLEVDLEWWNNACKYVRETGHARS